MKHVSLFNVLHSCLVSYQIHHLKTPAQHIATPLPLQSHHFKTHNTSPHATSSHIFHFSRITSRLTTHPHTTSSHIFHFSHITSRLTTHPLTQHQVTSSIQSHHFKTHNTSPHTTSSHIFHFSHITSRLTTHPLTQHQVTSSTSVTSLQDSQHIPSRNIKSHLPLQSHQFKTRNTSPHATSNHIVHASHHCFKTHDTSPPHTTSNHIVYASHYIKLQLLRMSQFSTVVSHRIGRTCGKSECVFFNSYSSLWVAMKKVISLLKT